MGGQAALFGGPLEMLLFESRVVAPLLSLVPVGCARVWTGRVIVLLQGKVAGRGDVGRA